MRRIRSRHGFGLIDVMVTLTVICTAGLIFSLTFPASYATSTQAGSYKQAAAVAQEKMEQMRALNYESLTYTLLQQRQFIDSLPASSPYSFTTVSGIGNKLPQGIGELRIEDIPSTELKQVTVTVKWQDTRGRNRSVQLTTLFADKRPRHWIPDT